MAYLKIDRGIAEQVNADDLIQLLNDIIDEETAKPLAQMDCDLIDGCVDALLALEKEQNNLSVLVPLMRDEQFLRIVKRKMSTWSSLGTVARTAIIAAAIMGSTITVNAMVDNIFDYNILEHIGEAIGKTFGIQPSDTGPEIILGEDDDEEVSTTKPVSQSQTTTQAPTATTKPAVNPTQPSGAENTSTANPGENTTQAPTSPDKPKPEETAKPTDTTKKPETTTKNKKAEDVYHKTTEKEKEEEVSKAPKVIALNAVLSDTFQLHYIFGETLSYDGLTLTASMSDGTTKAVSLEDCVYTDQVDMQKTADVTLSILYKGFLVEIDITVRPNAETRISEIKSNERYEYLLCAQGAYITAYKGNDSDLCCDYTDGAEIFAVSNSVFREHADLRSVELPYVTHIGNSAFEGCSNLIGVSAPRLQSMGDRAFYNCTALTTVEFGSDLETLGEKALAKTALQTLTLGEKVTEIPASLCEECTALEQVDLLGKVTQVGAWAFAECAALHTVNGTASIQHAGAYAFSNCTQVQFDFPQALETAGENAFYFCRSLKIGDIPQTMTAIGANAFAYCSGITAITIPKGITVIEKNAFRATNAGTLVLPQGVVRLEEGAFESCKFTSVELPASLKYIGEHALYTVLLRNVEFNSSTIEIDDAAFYLSKRLVFDCYRGSAPHLYAMDKKIKYNLKLDTPEIIGGEDD